MPWPDSGSSVDHPIPLDSTSAPVLADGLREIWVNELGSSLEPLIILLANDEALKGAFTEGAFLVENQGFQVVQIRSTFEDQRNGRHPDLLEENVATLGAPEAAFRPVVNVETSNQSGNVS